MGNGKISYLIASAIFSLLIVGYAVVIIVDLYGGYTPEYLVILHVMATAVFLAAAIANFKRYRKMCDR